MTRLAKTTRAGCSAVTAVAAAVDTAVATGSPTRRRASVACAPAGCGGMDRTATTAIARRAARCRLIPDSRISRRDTHMRQAWRTSPPSARRLRPRGPRRRRDSCRFQTCRCRRGSCRSPASAARPRCGRRSRDSTDRRCSDRRRDRRWCDPSGWTAAWSPARPTAAYRCSTIHRCRTSATRHPACGRRCRPCPRRRCRRLRPPRGRRRPLDASPHCPHPS